jgi:hypothetical protein
MFTRRMLALAAVVAALTMTSCSSGSGDTPSSSPPASPPAEESSPTTSPSPDQSDAPDDSATAAITIERPDEGETIAVPFIASGAANVFEAALTIDVVDESGMTACIRHLTATSGTGTPGTWQGMLAFPPEEDPLRVTMRAYTFSPRDGSMANLVELPLTISPNRPRIILTSPRCGDVYTPGGAMQLLGTASLFEAALTVELRDTAGTTLFQLPVTAEECCVESQFSSMMTIPTGLSSGFYDVVAYSLSAKDGSVENEFAVQIDVRG